MVDVEDSCILTVFVMHPCRCIRSYDSDLINDFLQYFFNRELRDLRETMLELKQLYKLLLLALAIFLAPFWIPIITAITTTSLVVLGGMLTILSMPTCVFLIFFGGIFAISLLFSTNLLKTIEVFFQRIQGSLEVKNESLNVKNIENNIEISDSWDKFLCEHEIHD